MMFNGTDYTIPFIVIISVIILFAIQYILCIKARKTVLKLIPLLYIAFLAVLAVMFARSGGGGFIDLSMLAALLILIYAAICLASILAAWIVYKIKSRK